MLKIEEETFGQPFRRGRDTRAEQAVNTFGGEPKNDVEHDFNGRWLAGSGRAGNVPRIFRQATERHD